MYELIQLTRHCFYIEAPAKMGLVLTGEGQACLIDSGNDKDAGKKVKRILEEKGWALQAIYNTHSHADHIGGNQYLQKQTGCQIYAPGLERDFTRHPVLEPAYLYGGNPPKELRHKFLMAQESEVRELTDAALPEGLKKIPLPGHSWDMAGFSFEEGVVYLADCLFSRETIEKYHINFLVDVRSYLETLERVGQMEAQIFVPAHAPACEKIQPLVEENIRNVKEICEVILEICKQPVTFEKILKDLFDHYQLTMTWQQYALVGNTVRSYLTYLKEEGSLQARFEENTLLWSL